MCHQECNGPYSIHRGFIPHVPCLLTELYGRLASAAGQTEEALLADLGPPLLHQLAEDVELWSPVSSDLLTTLALLRYSGQWSSPNSGGGGGGVKVWWGV